MALFGAQDILVDSLGGRGVKVCVCVHACTLTCMRAPAGGVRVFMCRNITVRGWAAECRSV